MKPAGPGRDQIRVPARLTTPCHQQRQWVLESLDALLPKEHAARKSATVVVRPAFHPRMQLLALRYATSRGIARDRETERPTPTDLGFRWNVGDPRVRRATLTTFRVRRLAKLAALFTELLAVLVEAGVVNAAFIRSSASPSSVGSVRTGLCSLQSTSHSCFGGNVFPTMPFVGHHVRSHAEVKQRQKGQRSHEEINNELLLDV
jgi:hypothetical protein